jgi:hypothetical protein
MQAWVDQGALPVRILIPRIPTYVSTVHGCRPVGSSQPNNTDTDRCRDRERASFWGQCPCCATGICLEKGAALTPKLRQRTTGSCTSTHRLLDD